MDGRPLIDGPVCVVLDIRMDVSASWSQKRKLRAFAGDEHPTKKPDIDNVEKIIFDALNGVVWRDDVQVIDVCKRKRYSATPGVTVKIKLAEMMESA